MAVKLLKMYSGEIVIAEEDEAQSTDQFLVVKRPLRMTITEQGIALQMLFPCDMDEQTRVYRQHIAIEAVAVLPLAAEYKSKFGAGLVTPPSPKLVVPG